MEDSPSSLLTSVSWPTPSGPSTRTPNSSWRRRSDDQLLTSRSVLRRSHRRGGGGGGGGGGRGVKGGGWRGGDVDCGYKPASICPADWFKIEKVTVGGVRAFLHADWFKAFIAEWWWEEPEHSLVLTQRYETLVNRWTLGAMQPHIAPPPSLTSHQAV